MKKATMKKGIMILAALTLLLPFTALDALAQGGPSGGQPGNGQGYGYDQGYGQQQGWYCPNCGAWHGRGGMGSGMMGPQGMHRGWGGGGMGPGMNRGYYGSGQQYGPQYRQEPLNREQAESVIENQYGLSRNPNLKLGDIEDKGDHFQADIVTKDNSLVDKLRVDKNTGYISSMY